MGWFKHRKPDPVGERGKQLSAEIKQLESQIAALQNRMQGGTEQTHPPGATPPSPQGKPANPFKANAPSNPPDSRPELVLEPVDLKSLQAVDQPGRPPFRPGKQIHAEGRVSFLHKVARFFRGPTSDNPQLIRYMAAGNIHGLKPLRYERRVQRNRLVLWVVILAVILIGLFKMFYR